MVIIMITTKVLPGYRMQIPEEIINEYNLEVGDTVIWIQEDDHIILKFKKNKKRIN